MEQILLLGSYYMIAIVIVWILLSGCVGKTAQRQGRMYWAWILFSLIFSPLLGAVMIHCLGPIEVWRELPLEEQETMEEAIERVKREFGASNSQDEEDERIIREADARIQSRKLNKR